MSIAQQQQQQFAQQSAAQQQFAKQHFANQAGFHFGQEVTQKFGNAAQYGAQAFAAIQHEIAQDLALARQTGAQWLSSHEAVAQYAQKLGHKFSNAVPFGAIQHAIYEQLQGAQHAGAQWYNQHFGGAAQQQITAGAQQQQYPAGSPYAAIQQTVAQDLQARPNASHWLSTPYGFSQYAQELAHKFGHAAPIETIQRVIAQELQYARNLAHGMQHTFSNELNFQPSRPASMLEHYSLANPIRYDAEGNRWLNCNFDMCSYKPEEIQVTLDSKNRFVQVEASHEVKADNQYVKRVYSRKVQIPAEVKVDLAKLEVKSQLSNEGVLTVEAVLPKLSLEEARTSMAGAKTLNSVIADANNSVYKVQTKTI